MSFTEAYLDELRAAVRVSEVVSRKFHLKKAGTEFQAVEDPSVTVNDKKRMWFDFGKGQEGGDVFQFLQVYEGLSFIEAVERIAGIAGIGVPGPQPKPNQKNGSDHARGSSPGGTAAPAGRIKREIVATYDYTDAGGRLLYQVVRFQFRNPDGGWETYKDGKIKKAIGQRRKSPDGDGAWIWGLEFVGQDGAPQEFMRKGPGENWSRLDEKNYAAWRYQERRSFAAAGNIAHTLYHMADVLDELGEERGEQRTIVIPEGEAKVDLLRQWGILATCNSGGASHFTSAMADMLAGAADIVILEDNDEASRKRTAAIAPMLLDRGCRVRATSFADHWKECPPKGDVVDWAARGGGTADKLFGIIERLPDWVPPPYASKFGARLWGQQHEPNRVHYEWAIKGIVPARENILIIGPSGSGKSYETLDMAMHVAQGIDFAGRRVLQMGVVYCCYEAGKGMDDRVLAYEIGNRIVADVPFAWLTRPPGIYASEDNAVALAADIKEITKHWRVPVGVVVIDTNNAATRGSSEIKSEDIGKIMERYALIQERTESGLWIVGHTNVDGEHRGNQQLYNGIETCLVITKVMDTSKPPKVVRDDAGRVLRRATVKKQREGDDGLSWDFVLRQVEIGRDQDGDAITRAVSTEPARPSTSEPTIEDRIQDAGKDSTQQPWDGRLNLNPGEVAFFKAMLRAVDDVGNLPPPVLGLPASVGKVVTWHQLTVAYRSVVPSDEEATDKGRLKYKNRIATAMRRARESLNVKLKSPAIGVAEVHDDEGRSTHYLWLTGRPVKGAGLMWPARIAERPNPIPVDSVTGETITSLDPNIF